MSKLKIVLISDTHSKHDQLVIPDGDVLVHAGDATMTGSEDELKNFINWFGNQPHKYKCLTWGNHDLIDTQEVYDYWASLRGRGFRDITKVKRTVKALVDKYNITVLNDSGIEIEGVKFWGSPVQPHFHSWAFNRYRGSDIQKHWDLIPSDTNVLITHGPPKNILDYVPYTMENVGCENLLSTINSRLNSLKVHVFGHIHMEHGQVNIGGVEFVNACNLNDSYNVAYSPIAFELEK